MNTEKIVDINKNNKEKDTTTSFIEKDNRLDLYKLVENYNKRTSIKLKDEFLKTQIKINSYLDYGTKMFLAQNIIEKSCVKNGDLHIDSCKKYILYIYTLIKFYTNIDIDEKDIMMQYDLLDRNNLVEKILSLIPGKELTTFKTILEMKQNDFMTNNYEAHAFISNQVNKIKEIAPELSKVFIPLVDKLNKKIESLDESKIDKMLNKYMKYIAK